ncbi:MAG: pantoate--beta-alanine ligase, partial [Bacteroidota bacterium]
LETYPRTPDADAKILEEHGCDFLYLPEVSDVYPDGEAVSATTDLDFGSLTERMEGANRPGHFDGVAQVVSRLLDIVRPTKLVMGQKDYQQVAVIRSMLAQLALPTDLIVVPTVREADGLAMSSRNRRLEAADREAAGTINRHLAAVAAGILAGWAPRQLEGLALDAMSANPRLRPEYVEVCDGETLLPYHPESSVQEVVVAAAVWCGPVRLIDNQVIRM